jgi:hypothetical protein
MTDDKESDLEELEGIDNFLTYIFSITSLTVNNFIFY